MDEPKMIICRHAESLEDVDKSVYGHMDLAVPLSERGKRQAHDLSFVLPGLLSAGCNVRLYASPGVRNVQTLKTVLPRLSVHANVEVRIEPLIVKQDWGRIALEDRPKIEAERYKMGVLRYAFPTGESAQSLLVRLTRFAEKALRAQQEEKQDLIVFSHGFEFRVLLMILLGWDEEEFESFANLGNCEYRILTLDNEGKYHLDRPLRKHGLPITRLLK